MLLIIISAIAIISSIVVISAHNTIHSILALISVVLNVVFIMLYFFQAEFLALTFVAVYLGAVAVLFLFVIMTLNVKSRDFSKEIIHALPIGAFLGAIFFCLGVYSYKYNLGGVNDFVAQYIHVNYEDWKMDMFETYDIEVFSTMLYGYYFPLLLMVGVILLIAMIGAISITKMNYKNSNKKRNFVDQQVARDFENAVFLINEKKGKKDGRKGS